MVLMSQNRLEPTFQSLPCRDIYDGFCATHVGREINLNRSIVKREIFCRYVEGQSENK